MVIRCDFYAPVKLYRETAAETWKCTPWNVVPPIDGLPCAVLVLSRDRHHRHLDGCRQYSIDRDNHLRLRVVLAHAHKLSGRRGEL